MSKTASASTQKHRSPALFWILIALIVLLLIFGIGSIAYYFTSGSTSRGSSKALWQDPWNMPEPNRITSGLAVLSLAGPAPSYVFGQAMAINDLDTMAATALLNPNLSANMRLGWLNTLAHRYVLAKNRDADARVFLRYTADLAMVLPDLPDYRRAEILLETASGWGKLKDSESEQWALDQALIIAQYSPQLSPALRKNLLEDISLYYKHVLENSAKSQEVRSIEVPDTEPAPPATSVLETVRLAPLVYPPDIETVINDRRQAAQRYVDEWTLNGGKVAAETTQNLGSKMVAEDMALQGYYQAELGRTDAADDYRSRVLFDQIDALARKYRASGKLYGVSLVPDWENDRTNIGISLRDSIVILHGELNTLINGMQPEDQPANRVAIDRLVMGWTILGLYVGADKNVIADALNNDIAALNQPGVYPRATVQEDGSLYFELFNK
jgi:hypothetical protein